VHCSTTSESTNTEAVNPPSGVSVSVVIPAKNEEAYIGKCLEALAALDFPSTRMEVVVVDNDSTDATLRVARSFTDRLQLTILSRPGGTISALRNVGARAARGRVLAFLDADCFPNADWLSSAVGLMQKNEDMVVGADLLIPADSTWVARTWYESKPIREFERVPWVPSGDMLMSRAVFDAVGGFNESIETNEDCELCLRVRMAGFSVYAASSIAVVHARTPQTITELFHKEVWHGTHVFRVFRQNVGKLQNIKLVAFAAYNVLAMAGVLVGTALAIARQNFDVLTISVLTLLLAPLVISLRRAISRKKPASAVQLFLLVLVYGFARAFSLLNPKNW
jgi:glycosyltransferase involved in cell wall biosynthesis